MQRLESSSGANPWQRGTLMLGMSERRITVGTAAWAIPKQYDDAFPSEGSHLVRYASRFDGVEINSSFYRLHRLSTYQRWAGDVPDHFRFAVKMPKTITHEARLRDIDEPLQRFLGEIAGLGSKLGPVLIQLPPSLKFDPAVVEPFVARLRASFDGDIVCGFCRKLWLRTERCPSSMLLLMRRAAQTAQQATVADFWHTPPVPFASCAPSRCHSRSRERILST
jgi:uncharacterized protein YecE (DUF72 family)